MKGIKFFVPLLLVAFFFSRCAKPLAPKYLGYENFRLAKAGFGTNILATDVKLYNPNTYPLQLKSANFDVYFNNNYLGHSSLDTLISLPGKDTTLIPLQLEAQARDLLSNAFKVFLNPDVRIKITGSAKAGRGGIFLNVPIDYEGIQRIDLAEIR